MSVLSVMKKLGAMAKANPAGSVGEAAGNAAFKGTTMLINKLLGKKWDDGLSPATANGDGESTMAQVAQNAAATIAQNAAATGPAPSAGAAGSSNIPAAVPNEVPSPTYTPPAGQPPAGQPPAGQPTQQAVSMNRPMQPSMNNWGWGRPQGFQRPAANTYQMPRINTFG